MADLPANWQLCRLDNIAEIGTGVTLGRELGATSSIEYPYLRVANVQDGYIDTSDLKRVRILPSEVPRYRLERGDVLLTEGGDFDKLGRGAVWGGTVIDCLHQNHIFRVRFHSNFVPEFFAAYMASRAGRAYFLSCAKQTTNLASINKTQLRAMPVPLPPRPEQQRIAEILCTLDLQTQMSVDSITKLEELRYASIRESMKVALNCFREFEASELHSVERRSAGPWALVPLDSVLAGIDAGHSPDLEDTPAGPGQWGVLKVSAVGNGVFRPNENKVAVDRALFNSSICVQSGDLLITRANTTQLVGRSCIVQDTPPGLMLCDKTLRLRIAERSVPVQYVQIVLGLSEIRRQIETAATGTSGSMKNISQQAIRRLMIPVGGAEDVGRVVAAETTLRAQIAAMYDQVRQLQSLKRGLMDDLLTGRVRVNGEGLGNVGID